MIKVSLANNGKRKASKVKHRIITKKCSGTFFFLSYVTAVPSLIMIYSIKINVVK